MKIVARAWRYRFSGNPRGPRWGQRETYTWATIEGGRVSGHSALRPGQVEEIEHAAKLAGEGDIRRCREWLKLIGFDEVEVTPYARYLGLARPRTAAPD